MQLPRLPTVSKASTAPNIPTSRVFATREAALVALSNSDVLETHESHARYLDDRNMLQNVLTAHAQEVKRARTEKRETLRQRFQTAKRSMRPSNPYLNFPQPPISVGAGVPLFGLPKLPAERPVWVPIERDEDDNTPVNALKRTLAANLPRVVELFRRWDVNCDGLVDVRELHDAVGALNLADGVTVWDNDTLHALFGALDTNGNGTIDFQELFHALRRYNPPPITSWSARGGSQSARRWGASDEVTLEMPRRRPPAQQGGEGSGKELEAVAKVKRLLAHHQARVIDFLRKHDHDFDSTLTPLELRRALAACSIDLDRGALRLLFKQIDRDGSGEISFHELNQVLSRKVDFDAGRGEIFDADRREYTTGHTHVRQIVGAAGAPAAGGTTPRGAPSMAPRTLDDMQMSAELTSLTPRVVNVAVVNETSVSRAKHAASRYEREKADMLRLDSMKEDAARSRHVHGIADSPRGSAEPKSTPRGSRRRVKA